MNTRFYTFKCPTCEKKFTYDLPGEPLCDGPGDVKSHEPVVMRLIHIKDKNKERIVGAQEGESRATGTLLTPDELIIGGYRVNGELWTPSKSDPDYDRLMALRLEQEKNE